MERFNPSDISGGYTVQYVQDHWKVIAGGILIVLVIYILYYRQNFINDISLVTNQIPFTSGADLRFNSIDSATNRGPNSIGFL